jgi:organic hydroperoxide reductase OsmC/OhrA
MPQSVILVGHCGIDGPRLQREISAKIPGADKAKFEELAGKAKAGCPVSKLFKADITLDAQLT